MKRWNTKLGCEVEDPNADKFLLEYEEMCRRHGLCLSHEDKHGAFMVERLNYFYMEWVKGAVLGKSISNEEVQS